MLNEGSPMQKGHRENLPPIFRNFTFHYSSILFVKELCKFHYLEECLRSLTFSWHVWRDPSLQHVYEE